MKSEKIVIGEVTKIHQNYIEVLVDKSTYICTSKQISDYTVNIEKIFKVGNKYKFLMRNNKMISYKMLRPKLIKNKKFPMPTISGSKNLEKKLNSWLVEVRKKDNQVKDN